MTFSSSIRLANMPLSCLKRTEKSHTDGRASQSSTHWVAATVTVLKKKTENDLHVATDVLPYL